MEIKKHEYVHIKMHKDEADELVTLLEQIDSGASHLPDWVKAKSIEWVRKIKAVGL